MKKIVRNLALVLALLSPFVSPAQDYKLPANITDGNILHCFSWPMKYIIEELPNIAAAGFGTIQISPLQRPDIKEGDRWYDIYLPYDYHAYSSPGMGNRAELQQLCSEAEKYGIKIIVDVAVNHVNKTTPYYNPWFKNEGRYRWWGNNGGSVGINYDSRYEITHNPLGDYVELNTANTEVIARAKAYMEELRDLGVKGIRFDAAKHVELPNEEGGGSKIWPEMTSVSGLFYYGEIVGQCKNGDDSQIREYAKYIWVPDNMYSTVAARENGGVFMAHAGGRDDMTGGHLIYWAESHDDYSNDEWSERITQDVVDRAYCALACRNTQAALYFSRPQARGKHDIKIEKGSKAFLSKQVVEVNKFRNAMVGKKDYFTSGEHHGNKWSCVTRENGGAVIVAQQGNWDIVVDNGGDPKPFCPNGTYVDRVSGNTFKVDNGKISGRIGATGVAIIYNSYQSTPAPESVTITGQKQYNVAYAGNFSNGQNYIYYYKGKDNYGNQWPGQPMERAIGSDGNYYWCFNVPTDVDAVIFNNGLEGFTDTSGENAHAMQTGNLPLITNYIMDNGGATIVPVTFTTGSVPAEPAKTAKTVEIDGDYNIAFSGCMFDHVHYWGGAKESTWPGVKLTKVVGSDGFDYYCAKIPADSKQVVFNNNDEKTGDLGYTGKYVMCESGATVVNVVFTANPPVHTGVFAYVDGWASQQVYCYAYNTDGTSNNDWPGLPMAVDPATGYWVYELPEGLENAKVIFSYTTNGTTVQYPAQNQEGLPMSGKAMYYHVKDNAWNDNPASNNESTNPGANEPDAIDVVWPSGKYCYFYNNDSWATPKVWAWISDSDNTNCGSEAKWPGDLMSKLSSDNQKYIWQAKNNSVGMILFSDNGKDQTGNLDFVNGATYYKDGGHIGGDDNVNSNPAALYMLGSIKDHSWATDYSGVKLDKIDKGIYIAYNVPLTASTNATFSFTTATASSWDELNANAIRFGAPSKNYQINVNSPMHVTRYMGDQTGACQSWQIAAGNYDVIVDLYHMTVTLLRPQAAPAVEAYQLVEVQPTAAQLTEYAYVTYPSKYGVTVNGDIISATPVNVPEDFYADRRNTVFTEKALVRTEFKNSNSYGLDAQTCSFGKENGTTDVFNAIVDVNSLKENVFESKVNYYYTLKQGVEVKVPMQSPAGSAALKLAVPEPKLLHSGISVDKSDRTLPFSYNGIDFNALYSRVLASVEIEQPNVTEKLGEMAGSLFRVSVDGEYISGTSYLGSQVLSPEDLLDGRFIAPAVELHQFNSDVKTAKRWQNNDAVTASTIRFIGEKPKVTECKVVTNVVGYRMVNVNGTDESHLFEIIGIDLNVTTNKSQFQVTNQAGDELKTHDLEHLDLGDWYLVEVSRDGETVAAEIVEGNDGARRFTFPHDLGKYHDRIFEELFSNDWDSKQLYVSVSTLYPFAASSRNNAPRRAQGQAVNGNVIETEASDVAADINNDDIQFTGVRDIVADEAGEVVYFNMQGIRVERPELPGVYVVRTADGRTAKLVVR